MPSLEILLERVYQSRPSPGSSEILTYSIDRTS